MNQEPADTQMDASLVLAGMDKSFPLSPTTGNSSPLDLSMKRDHERWPSLDLSLSPTKDEHQTIHFPGDNAFVTRPASTLR